MKITIVTLYRQQTGDHFVGAIKGTVGLQDRHNIVAGLDLENDDGESDAVGFQEVELAEDAAAFSKMQNCYGEEGVGYFEAEKD